MDHEKAHQNKSLGTAKIRQISEEMHKYRSLREYFHLISHFAVISPNYFRNMRIFLEIKMMENLLSLYYNRLSDWHGN
ncbi:MAG: hypothetical protein ABJP02_03930 [Parasphingorhabdus sp.]|uniref:hypothetical protein n=1 Tax=Parasphingorhabdus sp. TaxID=2709688 RepID=UPI003296BAA1